MSMLYRHILKTPSKTSTERSWSKAGAYWQSDGINAWDARPIELPEAAPAGKTCVADGHLRGAEARAVLQYFRLHPREALWDIAAVAAVFAFFVSLWIVTP